MSSLSPILDVVIGLAAVYAAFSLLASWCNEHVASWLQLRSKGLESALFQLLNGNTDAWKAFTSDPMYQALQQAADASYATRPTVKEATASMTAATAAPAAPGTPPPTVADSTETQPATPVARRAPSYMSSDQFSTILINVLSKKSDFGATLMQALSQPGRLDAATGAGKAFVTGVQSAAREIGIADPVNALLLKSGGDARAFVKSAEDLYDDHMDRLSGWYKRKSQKFLFFIGLALAIIFNVDSVRLYAGLSCNQALRGAVSTAAGKADKATPDATFVKQMLDAVPLGYAQWPVANLMTAPTWQFPDQDIDCGSAAKPWKVGGWFYVPLKLIGFLITALALSLGAPFWFDALSTLTRVRMTGKKPDAPKQK